MERLREREGVLGQVGGGELHREAGGEGDGEAAQGAVGPGGVAAVEFQLIGGAGGVGRFGMLDEAPDRGAAEAVAGGAFVVVQAQKPRPAQRNTAAQGLAVGGGGAQVVGGGLPEDVWLAVGNKRHDLRPVRADGGGGVGGAEGEEVHGGKFTVFVAKVTRFPDAGW